LMGGLAKDPHQAALKLGQNSKTHNVKLDQASKLVDANSSGENLQIGGANASEGSESFEFTLEGDAEGDTSGAPPSPVYARAVKIPPKLLPQQQAELHIVHTTGSDEATKLAREYAIIQRSILDLRKNPEGNSEQDKMIQQLETDSDKMLAQIHTVKMRSATLALASVNVILTKLKNHGTKTAPITEEIHVLATMDSVLRNSISEHGVEVCITAHHDITVELDSLEQNINTAPSLAAEMQGQKLALEMQQKLLMEVLRSLGGWRKAIRLDKGEVNVEANVSNWPTDYQLRMLSEIRGELLKRLLASEQLMMQQSRAAKLELESFKEKAKASEARAVIASRNHSSKLEPKLQMEIKSIVLSVTQLNYEIERVFGRALAIPSHAQPASPIQNAANHDETVTITPTDTAKETACTGARVNALQVQHTDSAVSTNVHSTGVTRSGKSGFPSQTASGFSRRTPKGASISQSGSIKVAFGGRILRAKLPKRESFSSIRTSSSLSALTPERQRLEQNILRSTNGNDSCAPGSTNNYSLSPAVETRKQFLLPNYTVDQQLRYQHAAYDGNDMLGASDAPSRNKNTTVAPPKIGSLWEQCPCTAKINREEVLVGEGTGIEKDELWGSHFTRSGAAVFTPGLACAAHMLQSAHRFALLKPIVEVPSWPAFPPNFDTNQFHNHDHIKPIDASCEMKPSQLGEDEISALETLRNAARWVSGEMEDDGDETDMEDDSSTGEMKDDPKKKMTMSTVLESAADASRRLLRKLTNVITHHMQPRRAYHANLQVLLEAMAAELVTTKRQFKQTVKDAVMSANSTSEVPNPGEVTAILGKRVETLSQAVTSLQTELHLQRGMKPGEGILEHAEWVPGF